MKVLNSNKKTNTGCTLFHDAQVIGNCRKLIRIAPYEIMLKKVTIINDSIISDIDQIWIDVIENFENLRGMHRKWGNCFVKRFTNISVTNKHTVFGTLVMEFYTCTESVKL